MARKPMVTRTIKSTNVNVMCFDITHGESMNKQFHISGVYKDTDKLLKVLKLVYETDDVKLVHIVDVSENETLYGMDEQKFIDNAEILPPRTKAEADEQEV